MKKDLFKIKKKMKVKLSKSKKNKTRLAYANSYVAVRSCNILEKSDTTFVEFK